MYQYFITSLLLTSLWKAARSRIRILRKTRRCVLMRFLGGGVASVILSYSILVSHEPNPAIYEKVFRNLHLVYDRQKYQQGFHSGHSLNEHGSRYLRRQKKEPVADKTILIGPSTSCLAPGNQASTEYQCLCWYIPTFKPICQTNKTSL